MRKRFRSRLLPLLLIMVVTANVITPGLMQPSVVYAAEEPANPQQGTETPPSIVLGKGTIEINGHLFTNAEFQTFLNNAEIIRVPFEKPSALALGEYDDLVGNGAGTAGTLTILTGAVVGAFQKLAVMFNLADLAGSSYVAIGTIGGVTLPLAIRFHSDSLEINDILINSFNKALVDLTNFFVNHKKANPNEEIVNPDADTGSGETTKPGEGTEGESNAITSNDVDWDANANTQHHIANGTNNSHRSGWNKFGIDPDDPDFYAKILAFLKAAVDNGEIRRQYENAQGTITEYYFYVSEKGYEIWVKIFTSDGVSKISDACVNVP